MRIGGRETAKNDFFLCRQSANSGRPVEAVEPPTSGTKPPSLAILDSVPLEPNISRTASKLVNRYQAGKRSADIRFESGSTVEIGLR